LHRHQNRRNRNSQALDMEINQVARNGPAVMAQADDGRQREAWACSVTCARPISPRVAAR
jgi:hypothetical protein